MTHPGTLAALLFTCVAASVDVTVASQQAPATFRAGVDLVVVDVVVIDKDGNPVTDLTAVDFGVTQVADGNWGVHAVLAKETLAGDAAKPDPRS